MRRHSVIRHILLNRFQLICYLFPRLKSALKGWRLCDATYIIKNATEELKRLLRNGFQNVSNNFTVAGRNVHLDKGGLFWKKRKCSLSDCVVIEKHKTHILCSITFFFIKNHTVYEIM